MMSGLVDLILTVSVRLNGRAPLPLEADPGNEQYSRYLWVRELLNHWAQAIEAQGLQVSLETIALNAVSIYLADGSQGDLAQIGDQLIRSAREIQALIVEPSVDLLSASSREEIAAALESQEPGVPFLQAARDITVLANSKEAKQRFKDFLDHVRTWDVRDTDCALWQLVSDIIQEEKPLPASAIKLFKTQRYFPLFDRTYNEGRAEKRRKIRDGA